MRPRDSEVGGGKKRARYIPALSYGWLTRLFDPFIRWTTPEAAVKRRLVEKAGIEAGNRVLDLGCGTATLSILIKQIHPEAEVVGLDGDREVLEIARAKVAKAGLDVTLNHGMAFELPYPDGSFDRVLSSLVFHHLTRENKSRAVWEVFRVLRPGGELHVADFGRPHNVLMYLISLIMRRFEEASDNIKGLLPEMFRDMGFCQVQETVRYLTIFGTISLVSGAKTRPPGSRGQPGDIATPPMNSDYGGSVRTPEEAARQVFGGRASYYTTSATHTDPQVLARVVELSFPQPEWRVLDVATGTGHTAFAVAPHVAGVIGVDLTPQMLAEGKQLRRNRSIANVDFHLADVHHLPFDDASFHLVTCRRAAHHFSHIAQSLQEMRRVLRPGGRLVIDDRSVPEDDFLDACLNELDRYHDESHLREYRPSEWIQMLEGLGFVVEEVEPYIQHRPITSLTEGASEENVRKIYDVLGRLNASQREPFNLTEVDGMPYCNHWYVVLSARREQESRQ